MKKSIKKFLSALFAVIFAFGFEPITQSAANIHNPLAITAKAANGTCGENADWELDEETGTLTISGSGKVTSRPWDVSVVRSIVIGDGITSFSFQFYPELKSVTIGKSFKTVINNASLGCFFNSFKISSITVDSSNPFYSSDEHGVLFNKNKTVLICYPSGNPRTDYIIPDSVITVDKTAFAHAEFLTDITVAYGVKNIGYEAFSYCSNLADIKIADSVTDIDSYAFRNCEKLKSITIPKSVTNIGTCAFVFCTALSRINVNSDNASYSADESGALFNKDKTVLIRYPADSKKTAYTVPQSVTDISAYAFDSCRYLNALTIPDNVTSIENYAFYNCCAMTDIKLPSGLTKINSGLFYCCCKLGSITLPHSVTSIGNAAFWSCNSLASVFIDSNVINIGNSAFSKCDSLTDVYYAGTQDEWNSISIVGIEDNNYSLSKAKIHFNHKHTYFSEIIKQPTCLNDGIEEFTCICTHGYIQSVPSLGHDIITDKAVDATCTKTGLTEGQHCSRCDDMTVIQRETPSLGHDIITDKAVDATCTQPGLTEGQHCSRCDDITVIQRETPSLGHNIITDKAVDATCTKTGLTEGQHCSCCDDMTVIQQTIPKEEHSYTEKYDSQKHWKECSCNHITEEQNHTFADSNRCSCGYVRTVDTAIVISNNSGSKTISYGETLRLTATLSNSTDTPENFIIIWYVDGIKKGKGTTFDISFESGTKTVEIKLADKNGIVFQNPSYAEIYDSETVTVKSGFFLKLISFFKNLFRVNRIVVQ